MHYCVKGYNDLDQLAGDMQCRKRVFFNHRIHEIVTLRIEYIFLFDRTSDPDHWFPYNGKRHNNKG